MTDKDKLMVELKAENERLEKLKCKFKEYCTCNTEKYQQTLQEIKNVVGKRKPFKDFSEIKTATEVEYDYAAICNELELRLHKVLELITKAESEG